jgi:hypothetical protein
MAKGIAKRPARISEISSSTFTSGLVPPEEMRIPMSHVGVSRNTSRTPGTLAGPQKDSQQFQTSPL